MLSKVQQLHWNCNNYEQFSHLPHSGHRSALLMIIKETYGVLCL